MFIFKVTEPSPLQDSPAWAKRAAYPEPPPVVPHPESLAAQAAYPYSHGLIVAKILLGRFNFRMETTGVLKMVASDWRYMLPGWHPHVIPHSTLCKEHERDGTWIVRA